MDGVRLSPISSNVALRIRAKIVPDLTVKSDKMDVGRREESRPRRPISILILISDDSIRL